MAHLLLLFIFLITCGILEHDNETMLCKVCNLETRQIEYILKVRIFLSSNICKFSLSIVGANK